MTLPLILQQATLALYPQALDDRPQRDRPVWLGGVAESLGMEMEISSRQIFPTGKPGGIWLSGPETHRIQVSRLWVQRTEDATDALPRRGRHVLEITWQDPQSTQWRRRRYRDVCFGQAGWVSNGRFASAFNQTLMAGRLESLGGLGAITDPVTSAPSNTAGIPLVPMVFVASGALLFSDAAVANLLGAYAFGYPVRLGQVTVQAATAGTGSTVLQLRVGGVDVVGGTVTLASGATTATADWSVLPAVPVGVPVTVRAKSGPATVLACAADVCVSLNLVTA